MSHVSQLVDYRPSEKCTFFPNLRFWGFDQREVRGRGIEHAFYSIFSLESSSYMGIQFPPIAFLYLLYLFIFFFPYIIYIFVQWYKALLNLNLLNYQHCEDNVSRSI